MANLEGYPLGVGSCSAWVGVGVAPERIGVVV